MTACGRGYGEKEKAEVIVTLERSPRACFGKRVKVQAPLRLHSHFGRAKPADFARFAGLKCSSSVYAHFGNLLEGGSADELKLS